MNYEQQKIKAIKENIAKMQLELEYYEAREVIIHAIENAVMIPNDYLVENGKEESLLGFDWWYWDSSIATEKDVLKKISEKVSVIKEHYTASNLDWVKPLRQATKQYFAYTNAIRW